MSAADFTRHVVEPRGELYRLVTRYANAFLGIVARGAACNAAYCAMSAAENMPTATCASSLKCRGDP
jgi:hypothetical protein